MYPSPTRRRAGLLVSRRLFLVLLFAASAAFALRHAGAQAVSGVRAAATAKPGIVRPSISVTTLGTPIAQNFDTLPASGSATWVNDSTLPGWYHARTGTGTTIVADAGSNTGGNLYSYGSTGSSDRALGSIGSGNAAAGNFFWGIRLTNNTGSAITSLDVSYVGEQWRNSAAAAQTISFSYLIGSPTVTGSLAEFQSAGTAVTALDFTSPITSGTAGALNGNLAANRTAKSFTITGLNIPNGTDIMLRWSDPDHTGSDHGLAIDDFTVTPNGGVAQPSLSINDVSQTEGNSGTTNFTFTVSLSSPAGAGGVSFNWDTADGTASAPSDYTAVSGGTGTITAGNTSTTLTVSVNGDTTQEPNETFFVNLSNVTGATVTDGQGQGTIQNDDVTLTPIHTIQGSGTTSPFASQSVSTSGIVIGVKSNGFFIQDPNPDSDPNTSEGIFVFTSSAPTAAATVGNNVQVSGTVSEFIPSSDTHQHPMTELSGTISVATISSGNSLPAATTITAADTLVNNLDNLEKYEGMRVIVPSLTTISGTQGTITESSATVSSNGVFYGVVTGVSRPFREPGINASDPLPANAPANVPRFDENPERLRVDSDAINGTAAVNVPAGMVLTSVTGPLDYAFRTYTIDPETTIILPGTLPTATAVPAPQVNELTVGSYNMERFFDTTDDPGVSDVALQSGAFNNRLNKVSLAVRNVMRLPDVLGVEEMENLSTLQAVANKINNDEVAAARPNPGYVAYLVEGNDIGGIDVGFLVKSSKVGVVDVTQLELPGCTHTAATCNTYTNPNTNQQELLNDRPPLVLRATTPKPNGTKFAFTVIVNHLRSLSSIDDETTVNGTGTEGGRVRAKRRAQAEFLANYIQSRQTADPTERIISVGDYNAFDVNDGYVDVIGTIKGTPAPADQVVLASSDLVNPDLTDLVGTLSADQKYSYSFDGNAQVLDHVIVNQPALASLSRFAYARNDADFPVKYYEDGTRSERESDHDMPVAYFNLGAPLVISEFRVRGPFGFDDEYVELFNPSSSPLNVSAADGTSGWALAYTNSAGNTLTIVTIPNTTVIPARGHYLLTGSAYSLVSYAAGDSGLVGEIPDDGALALFQTSDPGNFTTSTRVDAVSLNAGTGTYPSLFREGTNLPSPGTNPGEYAFVRKLASGVPQDTDNNLNDFVFVSTNGGNYGGVQSQLGAPGPENRNSPVNRGTQLKPSLFDPGADSSSSPNRERSYTSVPNGANGTLTVRRTFTNNTGTTVSKLRFRVVDITTLNSPGYSLGGAQADVRLLSATGGSVGGKTVVDMTLDTPPAQANGGGLNSSITATLNNGTLNAGDSISVQFVLGVQQPGSFRFFVVVEALPNLATPMFSDEPAVGFDNPKGARPSAGPAEKGASGTKRLPQLKQN